MSFESTLELWTPSTRLHILAKAKEVRVNEILNSDYFVTFLYPRTSGDEDRYNDLVDDKDYEVRFPTGTENGQHFRIKRVEEVRAGQQVYKLVQAHHVAFRIGQYFLDDYIEFAAAQPIANMLTMLGNNTPLTLAVEGSFPAKDIFEFGEKTKMALLNDICELYDGEYSFNNDEITVTTRKGVNQNVQVRYKKNLNGIKRTSHSIERITRLYGYGKNGLTIEGYSGHTTKYIDSVHFDPANPYEDKVEFPEIDTQSALLAAMQKHLTTVELPKVSYEIDMVELAKLGGEHVNERFGVGDTLTVFDEVVGYAFDARVYEYERYPFEPTNGRVVLANFREFKTHDYIFEATVGSKKAIVYTSRNAVMKGVKYDDSLTLVDGLGMKVTDDMDRVRFRAGQYAPGKYGAIALMADGTSVIFDEDGVRGGSIVTNTITAEKLSVATLSAISADLGIVNAGVINGVIINGGSINGSTFATTPSASGKSIEIDQAGLRAEINGQSFIRMNAADAAAYFDLSFDWQGVPVAHMYAPNGTDLLIDGNVLGIAMSQIRMQGPTTFEQPVTFSSTISGVDITDIPGLRAELDALSAALANKANTFHTHQVTIGNHNHGIPDGTNLATSSGGTVTHSSSGGGTYTAG